MSDATPITDEELAELRELEAKATPGEWEVHEVTDYDEVISRGMMVKGGRGINRGEEFELFGEDDAALIVALRNALPSLLARIEQLERENKELRSLVERSAVEQRGAKLSIPNNSEA